MEHSSSRYNMFCFVNSEWKNFHHENPERTSDNGHFLNLIWPESQYMGAGAAINAESGNTFIVARYDDGATTDEVNNKRVDLPSRKNSKS